jgi:hypothetical protein
MTCKCPASANSGPNKIFWDPSILSQISWNGKKLISRSCPFKKTSLFIYLYSHLALCGEYLDESSIAGISCKSILWNILPPPHTQYQQQGRLHFWGCSWSALPWGSKPCMPLRKVVEGDSRVYRNSENTACSMYILYSILETLRKHSPTFKRNKKKSAKCTETLFWKCGCAETLLHVYCILLMKSARI